MSQSLAEKLFGRNNPVDRIFYLGPHTYLQKLKVVGVVNSASLWKVESAKPMAIYRPFMIAYSGGQPILDLRTVVDPGSLKTAVDKTINSLGRQYSLRTVTVEERLDSYLTVQRLTATLSLFFGAIAVLLASVGLYGLMSFHVTRRTAELGIRVALGAQRGQVLLMILREAAVLSGIGCVIGFLATMAMSRYVNSILFGVSTSDPLILLSACLTLMAVALVAGLLPAKRASSVDPLTALRAE